MTDQPTNCIVFHESGYAPGKEVIRIDKEGFHYRDQFIAEAGEAHRLMVEFLRQNTQPELQKPTDEDLLETAAQAVGYEHVPTDETCLALARAVLARWRRPAIEPVPVAERLPGPEDLTDEHFGVEWCWWGKRFAGGWEWHQGGTGYGTMPGEFSYWLPHHALPVPQQEGAND